MDWDVTSFIGKRMVRSFLREENIAVAETILTDIHINANTGLKVNAGAMNLVFINTKL